MIQYQQQTTKMQLLLQYQNRYYISIHHSLLFFSSHLFSVFFFCFHKNIQSDSVAYKNLSSTTTSSASTTEEVSSSPYKNSGNNASIETNKPKPQIKEIVEARKDDLLQGARNWNEDFQNVLKIKGKFCILFLLF